MIRKGVKDTETKVCVSCHIEKALECFSKNRNSPDGHKDYCKECSSSYSRRYREKHRDEINARKRMAYHESKAFAEERTAEQEKAGVKVCTICGVEKPISEFYKKGNGGFCSECKACANAKSQQYHEKNRDAIIDYKRNYHRDNKEAIDAYNREYYKTHSDEIKARVKQWVADNPEKARENAAMDMQRRLSRSLGLETTLTKDEWHDALDYFTEDSQLYCAYCGKPIDKATQEHIIPRASGGGYVKENIIPVCFSCNCHKSKTDWLSWYRNQTFYLKEREDRIREYCNPA